jgi:hypothetical protein
MLTNARQNEEILNALAQVGYDHNALQKGQQLLEQLNALTDHQKVGYGDKSNATRELQKACRAAEILYRHHRKMAQAIFKHDPGRLIAFTLSERKKLAFTDWLAQGLRFYSNILDDPEALTMTAPYNLTAEKLNEGFQLFKNVQQLKALQEQEKGKAQNATRKRNQARQELIDWLDNFKVMARVALADAPELLDILQINIS